jgi:hypothetical protein
LLPPFTYIPNPDIITALGSIENSRERRLSRKRKEGESGGAVLIVCLLPGEKEQGKRDRNFEKQNEGGERKST